MSSENSNSIVQGDDSSSSSSSCRYMLRSRLPKQENTEAEAMKTVSETEKESSTKKKVSVSTSKKLAKKRKLSTSVKLNSNKKIKTSKGNDRVIPEDMKDVKVKIMKTNMKHYEVQYKIGEVIKMPDNEKFDSDPFIKSGAGGLYWSTVPWMHKYSAYGTKVAEIEMPTKEQDPDFQIMQLSENKSRSSSLIITKTYSLYEEDTYTRYGLDMSKNEYIVAFAVTEGNMEFLKMFKNKFVTGDDDDIMLYTVAKRDKATLTNLVDKWMKTIHDESVFNWLMDESKIFKCEALKWISVYKTVSPWPAKLANGHQIKNHIPSNLVKAIWIYKNKHFIKNPKWYLQLILSHVDCKNLLDWVFEKDAKLVDKWINLLSKTQFSFFNASSKEFYYTDSTQQNTLVYLDGKKSFSYSTTSRSRIETDNVELHIQLIIYILEQLKDDNNTLDDTKKKFFNALMSTSSTGIALIPIHVFGLSYSKHLETFLALIIWFVTTNNWNKQSLIIDQTNKVLTFNQIMYLNDEFIDLLVKYDLIAIPFDQRFSLINWRQNPTIEAVKAMQCEPRDIKEVISVINTYAPSSNSIYYTQYSIQHHYASNIFSCVYEICSVDWFKRQDHKDMATFISLCKSKLIGNDEQFENITDFGQETIKAIFEEKIFEKPCNTTTVIDNGLMFWIKYAIKIGCLTANFPSILHCRLNKANIEEMLDLLESPDHSTKNSDFIFGPDAIYSCLANVDSQKDGYNLLKRIFNRGQKMEYSKYFTILHTNYYDFNSRSIDTDCEVLEFAKNHGLDANDESLDEGFKCIINILCQYAKNKNLDSSSFSNSFNETFLLPIEKDFTLNPKLGRTIKYVLDKNVGEFVIVHRSRVMPVNRKKPLVETEIKDIDAFKNKDDVSSTSSMLID